MSAALLDNPDWSTITRSGQRLIAGVQEVLAISPLVAVTESIGALGDCDAAYTNLNVQILNLLNTPVFM